MTDLQAALAAHGSAVLALSNGKPLTATTVLENADAFERSNTVPNGATILSLDGSPSTLLSLLVVAERRSLRLILGRESIQTPLNSEPDLIVHDMDRVDRISGSGRQRHNDHSPGILLLTSGTTGTPKIVHQTLPALLGRVKGASLEKNRGASWLLTYETHSFAGLQVVLSAAMSGSLLVTVPSRAPSELVKSAMANNVTHISGTPTFWRAFLMTLGPLKLPSLRQVTLGGEAIDQATLDRLSLAFPDARISHIYASTEAGSLFAVHDGRAGFPKEWLDRELPGGIRLGMQDGTLRVRSPRRMQAYASGEISPVGEDGWLSTGDLIQIEGDRVLFCGRLDQVVNVAGLKVFPQEIESFLLSQPQVADVRIVAVPSPLTGALLTAQVVLASGVDSQETIRNLQSVCSKSLPRHKVPRRFEVLDSIPMSGSGKKVLA